MTMTAQRSATGRTQPGWLPLIAICLGYFLVILDVTVVNVALPAIGSGLGAGVTVLQWVVDGYTLAFAGLLLFCGGLSDRSGGKRVFLTGLAVFTLASVGCGLAPSAIALVGARLVQGTGAAMMVPASLALLRHAYPDRQARARAFRGVGDGRRDRGGGRSGARRRGGIAGRVAVGLPDQPAVRRARLPAHRPPRAAPAAGSGIKRLESRGKRGPGLDVPAQAAGLAGLTGLTGALIEAGLRGWGSPVVLGGFALATLALGGFTLAERHSRAPMVPLELFRTGRFGASAVVGLLLNLGFYGMLFLIPLYFERLHQFSPAMTGLAMLPLAAMPMMASPLGGRAAARGTVRTGRWRPAWPSAPLA